MNILHMKEQNYEELVKEGIVLVDFYADWCGPCKMLGPMLEALANERNDVRIVKVNVDELSDLASQFGIISVPTLYLYKDGIRLSERRGFHTLDMLKDWINSEVKQI
jgi:thioredoxin 1